MRIQFLTYLALGLSTAVPLAAANESQVNFSGARSSGRLDPGGVTAREQAMGRAATAAGQGPGAFLANPALLAGQDRAYGFDQNMGLFNSRSLLTASHGWRAFSGALALGYADLGSVSGLKQDGLPYNVRPYQMNLDLGVGKALGSGFSAGLAAHSLLQDFGGLGSKAAFGVTGGVGFAVKGWVLAATQTLESDLDRTANTMLSSASIGAAWSGAWMRTQKITLAGQLDDDGGISRQAGIGIENWSFGVLALRGGYKVPIAQEFEFPTWTAGLGVAYGDYLIDFSYSGRDALGSSQRVTLTWTPRKEPESPAAEASAPAVKPVPKRVSPSK